MSVSATELLTTSEVAEKLRCSDWKVRKEAKALGLGIDLGGRAGYRYSLAELDVLSESMRPAAPVQRRRRPRRSA